MTQSKNVVDCNVVAQERYTREKQDSHEKRKRCNTVREDARPRSGATLWAPR